MQYHPRARAIAIEERDERPAIRFMGCFICLKTRVPRAGAQCARQRHNARAERFRRGAEELGTCVASREPNADRAEADFADEVISATRDIAEKLNVLRINPVKVCHCDYAVASESDIETPSRRFATSSALLTSIARVPYTPSTV